jgi:hypothetical protein
VGARLYSTPDCDRGDRSDHARAWRLGPWDDRLVSRGGSANPGRTGRGVVILGLAVTFGIVGFILADWLVEIHSACGLPGPCSVPVAFFPWLAVGLIGGAAFGAVCAVGAIDLLRTTTARARIVGDTGRGSMSRRPHSPTGS